jgi:hypothetical protein
MNTNKKRVWKCQPSMVGSYSSTKWWETNWMVMAVFPTPESVSEWGG